MAGYLSDQFHLIWQNRVDSHRDRKLSFCYDTSVANNESYLYNSNKIAVLTVKFHGYDAREEASLLIVVISVATLGFMWLQDVVCVCSKIFSAAVTKF